MDFNSELTLKNIKPSRAHVGEAQDEGPLWFWLMLEGVMMVDKTRGIFTTVERYAAIAGSFHGAEGELATDAGKVHLKSEGRACRSEIDYGLKDPMVFIGSKFDRFVLEPDDGRVVKFKARLQVRPETDDEIVKLSRLLKSKITVRINGETCMASDESWEDDEGEGDDKGIKREPSPQMGLGLPVSAGEGHGTVSDDPLPTLSDVLNAGRADELRRGEEVTGDPTDMRGAVEVDHLYDQAVTRMQTDGAVTAGSLQDQFGIGHERAFAMCQMMLAQGIATQEGAVFCSVNAPGAVGARKIAKPSTEHGEVVVEGQKPPQRPRKAAAKTATH